jgi:hypothetical protein
MTTRLSIGSLVSALLCASALVGGCGDDDGSGTHHDGGVDAAGPVSCGVSDGGASPEIVAISPENGASAVGQYDPIVITFGEPMDEEATIAAIELSGPVEPSEQNFEFTAGGTVLTMTGNKPLATGIDPESFDAHTYTLTIGACAKSAAGNFLEEPVSVSFATMRGIWLYFEQEVDPLFGHSEDGGTRYTFICAGDRDTDEENRGFVTYDISAIPEDALGISYAIFRGDVYSLAGDPFADFGALMLEHVTFDPWTDAFGAALVAEHLGPFLADDVEAEVGVELGQNATFAVRSDFENRVARMNRSQYRIRFDGAPSADGVRDMFCFRSGDTPADEEEGTPAIDGMRLDVLYLTE